MGRNATSLAHHVVAGNPSKLSAAELARRAQNDSSNKVKAGKPKKPKNLSPDAALCWHDTIALMKKRGILDVSCGPTLAIYCETHATWRKAVDDVLARGFEIPVTCTRKDGTTYETTKTNPAVRIKSDCEKTLLNMQKSLGLTPDTRRKVEKVVAKKDDPNKVPTINEYLKKRGLE
jgi:P27 family predicted phage terminase small subunit